MSKYYYHGVVNKKNNNDCEYSIDHLIPILLSEGIKSKRLLGIKENYGFNGLDYVCVCKKHKPLNKETKNYNAFSMYIDWKFSLIISDEIDAIKTEYLSEDYYLSKKIRDSHTKYSDLFDEYQVKDIIPISKIIGITIPFEIVYIYIKHKDKKFLKKVKTLIELAKTLNLDIVDSSSYFFPYDYEFRKNIPIDNNIFVKNKLKKLI